MRRALCIWLPQWPLQRAERAQPALDNAQARVVLYETLPRDALGVRACSPATWALGVRPGMPLAEALALGQPNNNSARHAQSDTLARGGRTARAERRRRGSVTPTASAPPADGRADRSPDVLRAVRYDPAACRAELELLAARRLEFSPFVALEEGEHPESVFLDLTGLAPLYGGEEPLVFEVMAALAAERLRARLALADAPAAAWAVAHYALDLRPFSPAAPRASSTGRASGTDAAVDIRYTIVPAGETLAAICPLPIAALRLPAQTARWLVELGLERVGQLAPLPRDALAARLGETLLRRWDQALGAAAETLAPVLPPAEIETEWTFESPVERSEAIDAALERLLEQSTAALAAQQRGAVQLVCLFRGQSGREQELRIGLYRPTAEPRHLLELARLQLERLALEPTDRVRVRVTAAAPLEVRQRGLFDDAAPGDARDLAALVDRLSSRLGRESVVAPRLVRDAQPERACRYEPLVGGGGRRRGAGDERLALRFDWAQRPLRLAPEPAPLGAVSATLAGPPRRFRLHGREQRVAASWGPERIESGWWRGASVRRDYYRVQTASGQRLWLFRRLADGRWFWHGDFD